MKRAHVGHIIKKPCLDKDILNIYRPVSNLSYLSKTIERVVAARLSAHTLSVISVCSISLRTSQTTASRRPLSACRMTSCVQWTTRTLSSCYYWTCRLHLILWTTMSHDVGVGQIAFKWFKSYLSDRVLRHLLAPLRVGFLKVPYLVRCWFLSMQHHYQKSFGTTT